MNIKRKTAFILALALCTGSMTAFAETNNGTSPANIEVKGKFVAASGGGTVIAADVTWDDMTFTYQDGDEVWNPDTHAYEVTNGGWTNETKNINVTNHSNIGLLIYTDYDVEYGDVDFNIDKDIVSLPTAEGTAPTDSPKTTIKIGVSGEAIQEDEKLGSIYVSIYENDADISAVSTEEELKAAVKKGGSIILGSDITLDETIEITKPCDIALYGHTITAKDKAIFKITGNATSICSGTLKTTGSNASAIYAAGCNDLMLEDLELESDDNYGLLIDNAKAAVFSSEFTGKGLNGANIGVKDRPGSLTLNRTIRIDSGIYKENDTDKVTISAEWGMYNFDPTEYVDTDKYDVHKGTEGWFVTEK